MNITKTDYLEYTFCKKNLWLKKHKPELFEDVELSDFEKKIIEEGNLADEEARHLFPGGLLVDMHGEEAVNATAEYIEANTEVIFQATFSPDGFYIRADILRYNPDNKGWELYEVKASNDVKRKEPHHYIKDLAFQKLVIEKSGVPVVSAGVIHLNKEYKREGKVNYNELFTTVDLTEEVNEMSADVSEEMSQMRTYLEMPEQKGCDCIYRGRSNQCTTFSYSNPLVPDYSVHDISRIGASKKLLTDLIDKGIYAIEDIDDPNQLTGAKRAQYDAYITGKPIVDEKGIAEALSELHFPLQFFDYEGYVSAIPAFDGFGAYEQVPFQYSLHILSEDGTLEHKEFLITEPGTDITKPLMERLADDIDPAGTVISWNSSYEKQRNDKLAELHPAHGAFLAEINEGIFDLMTIFSKQLYAHPDFKGSASIKAVLPVLVPELSYKSLNIGKGDQASERWEYMISDKASFEEKKEIEADLLAYCKQDTLAMVRIYEFLKGVVGGV